MPADILTLDADQIRGVLDAEPNENWDKLKRKPSKPRVTYTPPDWITGKRAFDRTSAWAQGLKDSVLDGDVKGAAGTLFSAPINFSDFLPSPEEFNAGEDAAAKVGLVDENDSKWRKRAFGATRGATDLGSNIFLAPGNIALGGAMGALGRVAQTASNPIVRGVAGLGKAAATGKFAVDAGHGVVDAGQRFAEARDRGDDVGMGSAVAEGVGNTAMLGLAGSHAVSEGVHATQEMLTASPELQKVHAQVTALVRNPADMQTAMNAIVTAMAANGGDVMGAAAPIIRTLYTWRANPHEVIDPANWGKGKPGAEQRRAQNYGSEFQKRWSAWDTPEANESGFGPGSSREFRHRIDVPEDKLYDLQADPQGFIQQTGDVTLAEKAVKEAGFSGYYYDNGEGKKVYAMFTAEPAKEIARVKAYDQPPEVIKPLQPEQVEQVAPAPEANPDLLLAQQIVDAHNSGGGSSFGLNSGNLAGSNKYMVSIYPEASEILDAPPTAEQIAQYIDKHRQTLQDPNVAIGTWADDGKHYLDLSAALDDRALAEKLGQKYNQKGIGQLIPDGFDYIPTGGTGEGIGFEAPAIHERLARELQPPAAAEEPAPAPSAAEPAPKRAIIRVPHAFMRLRQQPPAEERVLVPEAARRLHDLSVSKYGTVDNEKDAIDRFVKMAEPEVRYQVEQPQSGLEWYEEDIGHMEKGMQKLHPELSQPHKMGIFKALVAIASNGQKPNTNLPLAEKLYSLYKQNGRIPERQPDGKGWTQRGKDNAKGIRILNQLIDDMGEQGASEWLLQKHTVAELKKYNRAVSGKASSQAYGFRVMGPKLGIFGLNINGISETLTKDMWWSRTWNRYLGTLIENDDVVEAPRNDTERRVMDRAAAKLSKRVGLPISKIQAVLWYYEKQLYEALGARTESESFKDITDKILRQRGVLEEGSGQGGGGAAEVRADAKPRSGDGGDAGGEARDVASAPSEPRPAHPALKKKKAR